jgi:hypothetical protein
MQLMKLCLKLEGIIRGNLPPFLCGDPNQPVILAALAQYDELPIDNIRRSNPDCGLSDSAVIQIDAARFNRPASLSFG